MSQPNYNLCDVCGKKTHHGFFIPVDNDDFDRTNTGPTVDLCPDCMKDALIMFISKFVGVTIPDYEQGKKLAMWVEERKKNFAR